MLSIWTEPSGYDFGIVQEQTAVAINLPLIQSLPDNLSFDVISGSLPGGLRIEGGQIVGSPYIISNLTSFLFCIRASTPTDFADRTFKMSVNGANPPVFITPAGDLPIGPNQQLYALDSSYVQFQLEAADLNVATGKQLTYFIGSGDGQLPPGLTMTESGFISGFINPVLTLTPESGGGTFDDALYDGVAYDFAILPTDGFDTYQYDDVFFDYNEPLSQPASLNANYQFRVTITDGLSYDQRVFKIFVVGTDEFRADSTALDGFASGFTADSTYLRKPVWLSNSNLGTFRASNYLTVPVALYDKTDTIFRVEVTNQEVYVVSSQVAISDNEIGSTTVTVNNVEGTLAIGQYFSLDNYVSGASDNVYQITGIAQLGNGVARLTITTPLAIAIPNNTPFYVGTLSKLPPGTNFDINTGEIYGSVPYQQAVLKTFAFTITASRLDPQNTKETVTSSRQFTITLLGDVNSLIAWNSPTDLGSIPAGYISTLNVVATSNVTGAVVTYDLTDDSGPLPPGLTLNSDGEIIGTTNQYFNSATGELGIITFDGGAMTFDGLSTTFDKTYQFTVIASDQFGYSSVKRTFSIELTTPNTVPYSNVTTQPFLVPAQRSAWGQFIGNSSVFTPESIYRISDPNFGLQTNLKMIVYAGIQTQSAAAYVGAMGLNHKRKRFQFGSLLSATAIDPNTNNPVYEVVYVQMVDPQENGKTHLPLEIAAKIGQESETITVDESLSIWSINLGDLNANSPVAVRPDMQITADSSGYQASNSNSTRYFPNSISNWRARLSSVGVSERNYLPLWMRSIQSGSKQQLDYVLAIPICFCKVGTASTIISNIQHSGFEFNSIDYTVDRFTISAVTGYSSDKYLVFRNDRITV